MIFLWVNLLHIPRSLADLHGPNEASVVFEVLAMRGIALLLAIVSKRDLDPAAPLERAAGPLRLRRSAVAIFSRDQEGRVERFRTSPPEREGAIDSVSPRFVGSPNASCRKA